MTSPLTLPRSGRPLMADALCELIDLLPHLADLAESKLKALA